MTKCPACEYGNYFRPYLIYDTPDKYESWMGVKDVRRSWNKCHNCGLYISFRSYNLADFQKIYAHDYRDEKFRGKTIEQSFEELKNISPAESENAYRLNWLMKRIQNVKTVFDVGSGIGIFPWALNNYYDVECMETNDISIRFINSLGIPCFEAYPENKKYNCVTCVHVLEHIEKPVGFLSEIRRLVADNGYLFIEVPDAKEIETLHKNHNELSSDHVCFYSIEPLNRVLNKAGFEIVSLDRVYYKFRDLYRIFALCRIR